LIKDDEERRKWSMYLYGIDTKDASLYDIVLHVDNLTIDDSVEILAHIAKKPCFQSTQESRMKMKDFYLAAKAQAAIFDRFPSADVKSKNSVVFVKIETTLSLEEEITAEIRHMLQDIDGIKEVKVNSVPIDVD